MRPRILTLAVAAVTAVGCNSPSGPDSVPAGAYAYTGSDANGLVLVKGWLKLDAQDPSQVTGTWHLQPAGNAVPPGQMTGDGRLEGRIEGESLIVNLNPGLVYNNIVLVGRLDRATYGGRWTLSGIEGPSAEGTFDAVRH
jgi:hypothetical protein